MKNTEAIRIFLALGQVNRLDVFRLIVRCGDKGLSPTQIRQSLAIPPATLSFHLKELTAAGLVTVERQSRNLVYRPDIALTNQLVDFLFENCCGGGDCGISKTKTAKKKVRKS